MIWNIPENKSVRFKIIMQFHYFIQRHVGWWWDTKAKGSPDVKDERGIIANDLKGFLRKQFVVDRHENRS